MARRSRASRAEGSEVSLPFWILQDAGWVPTPRPDHFINHFSTIIVAAALNILIVHYGSTPEVRVHVQKKRICKTLYLATCG